VALSPIFGGVSVVSDSLGTKVDPERPPSSIPAGFDSVLQFSSYMLQRVLASNLAQGGLATLSARVPYQPELVAPKLRAAIGAHLTPFDDIGPGLSGPNVEVLLLNPRLQTLRSSAQPPPTPGTGGGSSTVPGGTSGCGA
jgi:hypothetical protein